MAFTNYTSVHPSVVYLNKSSEVHDGLKANLVLLTALLTYVKTSLIRDSYAKQLTLGQARYRVSQAISLIGEIDYPIALELAGSDLVKTSLTSPEYGLIHEVVRRGDSRPPVTEGAFTNVTIRDSRVCDAAELERATVFNLGYVVLLVLFTACIINLLKAHYHASRQRAAFSDRARSDNKWAENLERHAREWNVRVEKMTGTHDQISELLQEYQRFFRESSDKLNNIDCTVIQSYDQSTSREERLRTIDVLIEMIRRLAENQNSLRSKLIELYEALPRIGKFGRHLADRVAEVLPELGHDNQSDGEASLESLVAEPPPSLTALESNYSTQSRSVIGSIHEGADDTAEGNEWWKQEYSARQLDVWATKPSLQPPITPLLKSFDFSEFHNLHSRERTAQLPLHLQQTKTAELHEVVGRRRKVLDFCGRAVWRGVAESSATVLEPLKLTPTSIRFIQECHKMFTTDQDTECPCKHIADTVCDHCLRRVLCAYHCTICEVAVQMVASWYNCSLSSPKVVHDVIYYLLVFQGKAPARRKTLYPYERPAMSAAETVAARSRMYDPIDGVTSGVASFEYNLHRSCGGCPNRYPALAFKEDAKRCKDLSYSTWFIRHFSRATEENDWDAEGQRQLGPPSVLFDCPQCDERSPSASYNVETCSVTITPAPFTDQEADLDKDEDLEDILESLDLPETVSMIKPTRGTSVDHKLEALELPEVAKARMILRGKLESIIGTVLNSRWN